MTSYTHYFRVSLITCDKNNVSLARFFGCYLVYPCHKGTGSVNYFRTYLCKLFIHVQSNSVGSDNNCLVFRDLIHIGGVNSFCFKVRNYVWIVNDWA